ncbi:MAG TPA: CoA transferase [Candidatus Methylomirabilis sp.]|nr:CoA transferase [Candidatus Methylomirabilis sp.]
MSDLSWEDWIKQAEDPHGAFAKPEALDDLLIVDVSQASVAGMVCSSFLAELGAEVLKVEPPGGDPARAWGPPGFSHCGEGLAYLAEGRNKYYITLNLETIEGRGIFRSIARRADIVIEAYQPGVMDAWGIGYRQLSAENPGIVYAAISASGQYGPRAAEAMPEHDLTSQAASGLTFITGEPANADAGPAGVPTKAGPWLAGYAGGAWAAFGILAALHFRHLTGRGQMLDVTPAEGLMRYLEYTLLWHHVDGRIRERIGYYDLAVFPYTFVRVKDGWAFIAAYTDANFHALCRIMGRPDLARDERFSTVWGRVQPEHETLLRQEIESWSVRHTSDEILEKVMADPGPGVVVFGRVETPTEVLSRENWWERGCFQTLLDPVYGELTLQMPVWRMTETPPRVRWACRPAGYHNGHVYQKYAGLGPGALAELRKIGVL